MLKFLFYLLLFWFLLRVVRRLAGFWLTGSDNRRFRDSGMNRHRKLDDIEDASYTEIDETKR